MDIPGLSPPLLRPLQFMEAYRTRLLADLQSLPASRLSFRPSPSAWSVLQIVEHLILSEVALIADARANLARPPEPVSPRESVMAVVVYLVMLSPTKVPTPDAVRSSITPADAPDLAALLPRWDATRADLRQLLGQIPPDRLGSTLFRHPVSGRLTARQGLRFAQSHIRHHQHQIARLLHASEKGTEAR